MTAMTEAVRAFETPVNFNVTTRRSIPDGCLVIFDVPSVAYAVRQAFFAFFESDATVL
jgi:hypothetical protein